MTEQRPEAARIDAPAPVPVDSGRDLPSAHGQAEGATGALAPDREQLGRLVHATRLAHDAERAAARCTGRTKPVNGVIYVECYTIGGTAPLWLPVPKVIVKSV